MSSNISSEKQRREIIAQTAAWLRVLVAPDQIVELRALHVQRGHERPHTCSGFFDAQHLDAMAEAAVNISEIARGVYFTLNPLRPDILARRANRIDRAEEGTLAKDADVVRRHWLLIDADPTRDPHISSSEAEKVAALERIRAIRAELAGEGWPAPILGDSGNGYHLLYRIDLPADDGGIVERCLKALASKYDTASVKIDQKVFNAARICKLYGTTSKKGDNVRDRPHRRAKLLEIPGGGGELC